MYFLIDMCHKNLNFFWVLWMLNLIYAFIWIGYLAITFFVFTQWVRSTFQKKSIFETLLKNISLFRTSTICNKKALILFIFELSYRVGLLLCTMKMRQNLIRLILIKDMEIYWHLILLISYYNQNIYIFGQAINYYWFRSYLLRLSSFDIKSTYSVIQIFNGVFVLIFFLANYNNSTLNLIWANICLLYFFGFSI